MRGALIWEGGLFHFEKAITSLVHKKLGHKVEMLKYKKIGRHAMQESQSNPTVQFLNKPWHVLHYSKKTIPTEQHNHIFCF